MPAGTDGGSIETHDDTPAMTFGLATHADVEDVAALVQSAYRGDASRQGWTTEADFLEGQRVDHQMVREILDDPDAMVLTARIAPRLVGCCELRLHDGAGDQDDASEASVTSAYLGMFAVDPAIQAAGLGRRILAEAEKRVRDRWGARRLVITVIGVRSELIAWYERRGFRLTGNTSAFPYEDQRFGVPLRDDLEFVELAKPL